MPRRHRCASPSSTSTTSTSPRSPRCGGAAASSARGCSTCPRRRSCRAPSSRTSRGACRTPARAAGPRTRRSTRACRRPCSPRRCSRASPPAARTSSPTSCSPRCASRSAATSSRRTRSAVHRPSVGPGLQDRIARGGRLTGGRARDNARVSAKPLRSRAHLPGLRGQVRRRTSRLRAGLWTIAQTSLAVGAAWAVAKQIDTSPFFAPISAVISLSAARGQRTTRAIELVLGVAVGIAVADLIVSALGTGTLVLMLVVALAMGAALLLGGGSLLVSQAGVSAIFVATIERPHGVTPDRFVDALIGGAIALLISQVLLPRDPVAAVTNAAHALGERLGLALREVAAALREGDVDRARRALEIARGADPHLADFADAVEIARET